MWMSRKWSNNPNLMSMHKNRKILVWVFICVLAVALASCKSGRKTEDAKDGKLDYSPQANDVGVMKLKRTDFARQLLSNGKLVALRKSDLQFRTTGKISSINVRNGERVTTGAVIATLDRPDLKIALEASGLSLKKAELDMYDYLVGQGYAAGDTISVSSELLSTAKMKSGYSVAKNDFARASYEVDGTVLTAPFSGRVANIKQKPFDETPSGIFCTIVDDRSFEVEFSVMESEYSFLSVGLPVRVATFADESKEYSGKITAINPVVDEKGQVAVKAQIFNDGSLIDGMNVKVIVERMIPAQLVVPRSAVVIRDNMDVLFKYTDDGKAHWTYVTILYSNGESYVVEANKDRNAELKEGEQIIVSGNLNLADNSDVHKKQ